MKFRKKKLVKSALQMRMIASFLGVACVAAFFQVLLLNRSIIELGRRLNADSELLSRELPEILGGNLLITLCVLVPLMLFIGMIITHRIAGPIYRFERYFEALARGEEVGLCSLRKGDELLELCDKLNSAVSELKRQAQEQQARTEEAEAA